MAILAKEFAADTDTETSITAPKQSNAVETSGSEIGGQILKVLSALDIEVKFDRLLLTLLQLMIVN